jgi:hypothetical protein
VGWICPAGVLLQLGRKELDKPGLVFVFVFIFCFSCPSEVARIPM